MIIINGKGYYTERENLDGKIFLGQNQEHYIALWDEWYQNIPENQTYDYTDIKAWYKTHPNSISGDWVAWYQQRPAIPTDLASNVLEGWNDWEQQHPEFPNVSTSDRFGKVTKIYIDYPAYVQTTYHAQSRQVDDGLEKGLYYGASNTSSRDFLETDNRTLPSDSIKIAYANNDDTDEPMHHRSLVYPDENYFDIHQNTVRPWLDWLHTNAKIIAQRFLTYEGPLAPAPSMYNSMVAIYVIALRSLIDDLKSNENIDQYRYGILGIDSPENPYNSVPPFPVIALYSGDYIKRNKYLEPKHLSDKWIDYTICENDCIEGSDKGHGVTRYYPEFSYLTVRTLGLTIGFLDSITESDFINSRLSIIAISPISYPTIRSSDNPDYGFQRFEAKNKSFGIKKLSNNAHKVTSKDSNGNEIVLETWNNYSILNLPFYTVAFENDNEHLYNQYSFGKNLKYKKRFISSPVLTFPRFTGYCSHAIRYNEGVLSGSPDIRFAR